MEHAGTLPLETMRLRLRRIADSDARGLFELFSDERVMKYLQAKRFTDMEDAHSYIREALESYGEADNYSWVIEEKETGDFVGKIYLGTVSEEDETASVSYLLLHSKWGNGYAAEALRAVLGFAFRTVGYNRVQAAHSAGNPASGKVMRKAGMLYEGMSRESHKTIYGYNDCHHYGMLKKDCQAANTLV